MSDDTSVLRPYNKPFLPVPQQVEKLAARGMAIPDVPRASLYLSRIGYYRLSGYWYPLRQSRLELDDEGNPGCVILDDFREGTTFEQVISLYVFDRRIRLLMVNVLERIEVAFRTTLSIQLGQHSPWAYQNPDLLDRKFSTRIPPRKTQTGFASFLQRFEDRLSSSREDFVSHFRSQYSDPLPIWAAAEVWDFGMLSLLISGLKYKDTRAIASNYGIPRPELLPPWIRSLGFVRNVCAHHSRLWNKSLTAQPRPPKLGEVPVLDHLVEDAFARERFYSAAAIARFLQMTINPHSTWGDQFIAEINRFPEAPGISIGQAGFPEGWEQMALWRTE